MRENPSTGQICRLVPGKGVKNGYISPVRPESSLRRMCTKFGTAVGVADIINGDKFFGDRLT